MEKYWRRRALLLISSPVVLVVLLRKRSVQLAIALLAYFSAEKLFGVTPFTLIELVEFFSSNLEGAIAFVGLVVAFAAGRGFIESKQLDLRLALEAEIADLSEDASQLLAVCRRAATMMITVRKLGEKAVQQSIATNAPNVAFPAEVEMSFRELLTRSNPLAKAQMDLVSIGERFGDIKRKFGPVVRSSLITSISLNRAEVELEQMSSTATLMVIDERWSIEGFLVLLAQHDGASPEQFLAALKAHELRFQGLMGGAGAVGAGSIFRPSVLLTALLWWKLWMLRE